GAGGSGGWGGGRVERAMKGMAKSLPDGRANMIALGIAARLLGLATEALLTVIEKRLADKGSAAIAASRAGLEAGWNAAQGLALAIPPAPLKRDGTPRWLLSG